MFHPLSLPQTRKRGRNESIIKISFVLIIWGYTHGQLEIWMKNFKIGAPMSYYTTSGIDRWYRQPPCEGLFTPFIYSWKWLQRSLTNRRAEMLPLLSLQPPCAPLGKKKLHQKLPLPHRVPSMCLAPFLCGATANLPGCPEEAVPAAQPWWSPMSSQASGAEGRGHEDAGSNPSWPQKHDQNEK